MRILGSIRDVSARHRDRIPRLARAGHLETRSLTVVEIRAGHGVRCAGRGRTGKTKVISLSHTLRASAKPRAARTLMGRHLRPLAVLGVLLGGHLVLVVEVVVGSEVGVGRVAAWDGGGRERRWNALLSRTGRDRGQIAVLSGRGVLPGVVRGRVGVGARERSGEAGVNGAERVGDVVARGVHGWGRLEAEDDAETERRRGEELYRSAGVEPERGKEIYACA